MLRQELPKHLDKLGQAYEAKEVDHWVTGQEIGYGGEYHRKKLRHISHTLHFLPGAGTGNTE